MQIQKNILLNCNFIYGSCAEVERLWSIAWHILTNQKMGKLSPTVFEALIFLKLNKRLWDIHSVIVEADHTTCQNKQRGHDDEN
jgi:hypothetical protein